MGSELVRTLIEEKKILRCRRCGRPLVTDKSRKIGFGTNCYKKYLDEEACKILEEFGI